MRDSDGLSVTLQSKLLDVLLTGAMSTPSASNRQAPSCADDQAAVSRSGLEDDVSGVNVRECEHVFTDRQTRRFKANIGCGAAS